MFHINPEGHALRCSAQTPEGCKFVQEGQAVVHCATMIEAQQAYGKKLQAEGNKLFATVEKAINNDDLVYNADRKLKEIFDKEKELADSLQPYDPEYNIVMERMVDMAPKFADIVSDYERTSLDSYAPWGESAAADTKIATDRLTAAYLSGDETAIARAKQVFDAAFDSNYSKDDMIVAHYEATQDRADEFDTKLAQADEEEDEHLLKLAYANKAAGDYIDEKYGHQTFTEYTQLEYGFDSERQSINKPMSAFLHNPRSRAMLEEATFDSPAADHFRTMIKAYDKADQIKAEEAKVRLIERAIVEKEGSSINRLKNRKKLVIAQTSLNTARNEYNQMNERIESNRGRALAKIDNRAEEIKKKPTSDGLFANYRQIMDKREASKNT